MQTKSLRIGITTRITHATTYIEQRDALSHEWSRFLKQALPHAAWLALPNLGKESIIDYCHRWEINALILTGGEDIGVAPRRDETELTLLNWAAEQQLPVLGICRGMQLMGVNAGSTLKPTIGHVQTQHFLQGSFIGNANSFHQFSLSTCPQDFIVLAHSEDGEIEAIRHQSLAWEGWMWHPERESVINTRDINNLVRLFT
jgi:gamma-glutamyl-gamma-aminobutyrate hydrolase PuuD